MTFQTLSIIIPAKINIDVIYILSKMEFCYECLSAMVGDSVFLAWSGWWPSSIHSNIASSLDWHSRKEQAVCYFAHRGTHCTSGPPGRMVGSQSE